MHRSANSPARKPDAVGGRDRIVQRDARSLAEGYSLGFRIVEILSIVGFLALAAFLIHKLVQQATWTTFLLYGIALLLGLVSADFASGFVHWMGDTWGTPEWPVVGQTFIRPFREHHVDQTAITRHDFIETNGANCLVSLPFLVVALVVPIDDPYGIGAFGVAWVTSMMLWIFATNQFHKWAHAADNPRWVRALQRWNVILSPENHDVHHHAPFADYFCITTGWLNEPLRRIGFYRKSESLIHALTGALPRQDDIGTEAAERILVEEGIAPMEVEAGEHEPALALAEQPREIQ